ncbi:hypothetical protein [Planomonospora sp. ID82291]|uniref:hypothetical protein n=1 Tax=Planomonospora sp. ID82291 TaxID=2738136 RepID=UPI0018C3C037|nr:hypothetical protein [Planomonospora sp. ID82291]MBG0815161.1 hypothetical protein [Planomonospora sp. ID82291]
MIKKTVCRLAAVGVLAPTLALGGAGAVLADDGALWQRSDARATIDGASLKIVRAYTDGSGKVFFEELHFTADRNGATIHRTRSGASAG